MTTPTLEKAAAVIEALERDGHRFLDDLSGYEESTLITYIATAIRQACNEKLEEAARIFEEAWLTPLDGSHPQRLTIGGPTVADRIRAIKDKSP
jgi:hypothetical protein